MTTCDVLIAGGGPAGSACAWKLRQAGLDVVVMDKATFPRDKVCAGWITPQVVDDLAIDVEDYRATRTFQPITGFRVGLVGGDATVHATYDRPVSFGIRRCEFDQYLLQRSRATLRLGEPVGTIRRDGAQWVVNETMKAAILIGAGGHFCPVARMVNGAGDRERVIAAQEVEFAVEPSESASFTMDPEQPELYFCRDLRGYGWCFRKERYLNIGFGRLGAHALPKATAEFVDFLKARRLIPADASWKWRGHAYRLSGTGSERVIGDGIMLIGDAAGLAYPQSGEGIRPAIESGLMAASTILKAEGRFSQDRLEPYVSDLRRRFGGSKIAGVLSRVVPSGLSAALARKLLDSPWFVRHVVLQQWFLHANEPALQRA